MDEEVEEVAEVVVVVEISLVKDVGIELFSTSETNSVEIYIVIFMTTLSFFIPVCPW